MQVYHDFFWYPDPDQRFLIRIRIRILANDTDPNETLFININLDSIIKITKALYYSRFLYSKLIFELQIMQENRDEVL